MIWLAGSRSRATRTLPLPLLAACLLTDQECVLTNVPRIRDVEVMARLLADLGARSRGNRHNDSHGPGGHNHQGGAGSLSGCAAARSVLLSDRCSRAWGRHGSPARGDFPARRTINTHLDGLQALGARLVEANVYALEAPEGLKGASFYLEEASVTGTETVLLAAACAEGPTEIRHAATEPHVVQLCRFLRKMGVGVSGEGSSTIRVESNPKPRGASERLDGDYIEAGSWAVVAAMTASEGIEILGARREHVEVATTVLQRMGIACDAEDGRLAVRRCPRPAAAARITTGLWPGFPSDLVSLFTVLATRAEGRTLVHDWMYELRLFALEQLSGMGADFFLCDPHRIIITGPRRLRGRTLDSRDCAQGGARGGAPCDAKAAWDRLKPSNAATQPGGQPPALGAKVEKIESI